MNSFLHKLKVVITDRVLRKRVFFLLGALIVFRLLAAIPIPGVDTVQLQQFLSTNQFFGLLNIFSGGGLSQLSILMLGVGGYITAAIIMQLLTVMSPKLKTMYHDEGMSGRKKFNQYSRLLTVPISLIQGFGLIAILSQQGIFTQTDFMTTAVSLVTVTAGAIVAMWLGELMTEFGIGNGISLLIFAGIIASVPQQVSQLIFTFDPAQLPTYIGFLIIAILVVAGVIAVSEAERAIPITYAKQVRGGQTYGGTSTYLPLRINQAGVMPIIFALSILLFPQVISNFLLGADSDILRRIGEFFVNFLNTGWLYSLVYFIFVFGFTYFYTAITFDPDSVATNLQKGGAFIPGIRPGEATSEYIAKVMGRITLVGGLFLGLIAVLPIVMQSVTGIQSFALGGTSLLIAVAVVLDLMKRIDAQASMREY